MPSFPIKSEDFILSAGDNVDYIDISMLQSLTNPRIVAVDIHLVVAVGTALVSVLVKDDNQAGPVGIALIQTEPLWQASKGVTWLGHFPVGVWAKYIAVQAENATASDKIRCVLVVEHD